MSQNVSLGMCGVGMTRTSLIALAAALAFGASAHAANLVANGGFEDDPADGSSIPSWTVGTGIIDDQTQPNTGAHDAAFTSLGSDSDIGVLSQDLNTTAGAGYTLAFSLLDLAGAGGFADSFTVNFGGFSTTITGDQAGNFSYAPFSFNIDGSNITGPTTTLSFQGQINSFSGDPFNLDDVSVTENGAGGVPEPAAWALMLTGFLGAGAALRRRQLAVATVR